MSLEKLYSENEKKEKEKHKLDRQERFLEEQKVLRESSDLLQTLALKISQEFGIDINRVKEYIKGDTLGNLEGLKNTLGNTLNTKEFETAINNAREKISELSVKNREKLKAIIEDDSDSPENFYYNITEKYFKAAQKRALYPETLGDQIVGVGLGIVDTTEAVILFLYGLGKGILLTPYHIYLLMSGKAEFEDLKKI